MTSSSPRRCSSLLVLWLAAAVVFPSCATHSVGELRFANREPVWLVNDRVKLTNPPRSRGFPKLRYFFDRFFYRRVVRALDVESSTHALNVNSIDEVPDSTWFENRIGTRELSAEQIKRGPSDGMLTISTEKWKITGTKVGGKSAGLVFRDAADVTYILKFDAKGEPEMETASNVVTQRLLWAAGFHVPDDNVVFFSRDKLVLADDAVIKDTFGNKRPMTEADLDETLARVQVGANGRFRGLASRFLPGVPIGGISPTGTRPDDPNDRVPHQHRRELRGQYVIFSWLNHTDVKQDNTLDMFDPQRGYVMHYLVDFGKALGALGWIESREEDGFGHSFDAQYVIASVFGIGLWRRPWEGADGGVDKTGAPLLGVGRFESKRFEPWLWKPAYPWEPFNHTDRFDAFWAAKIVARFRPEHIRAAVDAAQYSSAQAANYIFETLVARQRKIVRHWFAQVSALDRFEVVEGSDGSRLCFTDLNKAHADLVGASSTSISAQVFNLAGQVVGQLQSEPPLGQSRRCLAGSLGPSYSIVRIRSQRSGRREASKLIDVHLSTVSPGAKSTRRVIGLERH